MEYLEFSDIKERYKPINGFPDYYITESGSIYSTRTGSHRLHKLKPKDPGKPEKYLNIILCNNNGQYTKSIHRLVAEHFVEGYFEGAVVNHIDGNNRNNKYDNLEWVTTKENIHKSYITSGKSARRNFREWRLYDPNNNLINIFYSHKDMEKYVVESQIPAMPCILSKHGESYGYYVIKQ